MGMEITILIAIMMFIIYIVYINWTLSKKISDTARICGEEDRILRCKIDGIRRDFIAHTHIYRFQIGQTVKDWEVIGTYYTSGMKHNDPMISVRNIKNGRVTSVLEDDMMRYSKEDIYLV